MFINGQICVRTGGNTRIIVQVGAVSLWPQLLDAIHCRPSSVRARKLFPQKKTSHIQINYFCRRVLN